MPRKVRVRTGVMAKLTQYLRQDQPKAEKPPKSPIPCKGTRESTTDGVEYDCDYEHAGDVDCQQCICGGGDLDPRTGKKYRHKVLGR